MVGATRLRVDPDRVENGVAPFAHEHPALSLPSLHSAPPFLQRVTGRGIICFSGGAVKPSRVAVPIRRWGSPMNPFPIADVLSQVVESIAERVPAEPPDTSEFQPTLPRCFTCTSFLFVVGEAAPEGTMWQCPTCEGTLYQRSPGGVLCPMK